MDSHLTHPRLTRPSLRPLLARGILAGAALWLTAMPLPPAAAAQSCDEVFDSLERTMTLPYRLSRVLVANPAPAQPPTSVQEFVPPDRYHIINRDPGSPRPEVAENETIVIGSLLYLRQGTGPWIQTTMPQNAVAAAALTPDRRNISCMPLPPEADAPATSQAYEFHAQNQDGTSGGRIWIGGDGLPLRIEITSKLEEEGTNSWLGTFEYGTDIGPIEAPTPGP